MNIFSLQNAKIFTREIFKRLAVFTNVLPEAEIAKRPLYIDTAAFLLKNFKNEGLQYERKWMRLNGGRKGQYAKAVLQEAGRWRLACQD